MTVAMHQPHSCYNHQFPCTFTAGDMIGCDNEECEIEWFHYPCVGLSQANKPTGRWYCPYCRHVEGPDDLEGDWRRMAAHPRKRESLLVLIIIAVDQWLVHPRKRESSLVLYVTPTPVVIV